MRVDVEGLQAWSAQCERIADELAAVVSAAPPGVPSGQATATAVSTGQTLIGGTASLMAARVGATGTQSATAAVAYAANEGESARRLAGVALGSVAE